MGFGLFSGAKLLSFRDGREIHRSDFSPMPWSYTKRQIKRMPYQSRDVPLSGAGWNICCMPVVPGQQDEKDMEKIVKGKISI